jgi:hypothetical protein
MDYEGLLLINKKERKTLGHASRAAGQQSGCWQRLAAAGFAASQQKKVFICESSPPPPLFSLHVSRESWTN